MKETRMYREAKPIPSFFVGCNFRCKYCQPSFQRQMKRRKHECLDCYNYIPHEHWERFRVRPPKTEKGEFLFLCDFGDVSFASHEFMLALIGYCYNYPDRTFLIQSKNPARFFKYRFPDNVILATTIETNDGSLITAISKAPSPSTRCLAMVRLKHRRKAITVEPVMDFNGLVMVSWLVDIASTINSPLIVYYGYDSHPRVNRLPEPSLAKTKRFIKDLAWELDGVKVRDEEIISGAMIGKSIRLKLIRKAWYE